MLDHKSYDNREESSTTPTTSSNEPNTPDTPTPPHETHKEVAQTLSDNFLKVRSWQYHTISWAEMERRDPWMCGPLQYTDEEINFMKATLRLTGDLFGETDKVARGYQD